jgi:hypothetical protein
MTAKLLKIKALRDLAPFLVELLAILRVFVFSSSGSKKQRSNVDL